MKQFIIGIDVAKEKCDVSVYYTELDKFSKCITITNDEHGLTNLLKQVQNLKSSIDLNSTLFVFESTGHYHMQLCDLLSASSFDVHVFDPIITGQMHASSIRQTKNDRIDSRLICKIAFDNKFDSNYIYDSQREELKSISRFRSTIAFDCSRIKIRLQSTLDYLFPEYNSLFKEKYGKLYIELLANYTLNELAVFRIDKLTNICSKLSKGHKSKEFATQLQAFLK